MARTIERIGMFKNQYFGPFQACIYCGSAEGMRTDEHVIPRALGGRYILVRASCEACQIEIGKFEELIVRREWQRIRQHMGLPVKRPAASAPMLVNRKGVVTREDVPMEYHVEGIRLVYWSPPCVLTGAPLTRELGPSGSISIGIFGENEVKARLTALGADGIGIVYSISNKAFARFLTKIAYGFAVMNHALDMLIENYAIDVILSRRPSIFQHYVGKARSNNFTSQELFAVEVYTEQRDADTRWLLVDLGLFIPIGGIAYTVVIGTVPGNWNVQPMAPQDGSIRGA